jgi:hypothetical protein
MVPSSSIAIAADGERLTCGGLSLGEPVRVGNFQFIANYFGGLSLYPRRGDEATAFVGSTHSWASTLQWATMEDSIEEFLTVSCVEGSFGHPSPRWHGMRDPPAPITTTSWPEKMLETTAVQQDESP